jgi:hypothetical protein
MRCEIALTAQRQLQRLAHDLQAPVRFNLTACMTLHEPSLPPLCIVRPLQPFVQHIIGPAFHINQSLCTALFAPPVEVVGNRGRSTPPSTQFSNSPQFHSRDLENSPAGQLFLYQPFQPHFHFSCLNDGYYCLFSLSLIRFPNTRRASHLFLQTLPSSSYQSSRSLNRPL